MVGRSCAKALIQKSELKKTFLNNGEGLVQNELPNYFKKFFSVQISELDV